MSVNNLPMRLDTNTKSQAEKNRCVNFDLGTETETEVQKPRF